MARKHTEIELLRFIQFYLEGTSYRELVEKYKLELSSRFFRDYVKRYELHGVDGIKLRKNDRRYTNEFKEKVVSEYLKTNCSPNFLARKYNIPSKTTVINWINRYTEGKENKTYSPKSEVYNIMGAKKSYEEKVEIV